MAEKTAATAPETTTSQEPAAIPDSMAPKTDDPRAALQHMIDGAKQGLESKDPHDQLPKIAADKVRAAVKDAEDALESGDAELVQHATEQFRDTMREAAALFNATVDPAKVAPATAPYGTQTTKPTQTAPNPHAPAPAPASTEAPPANTVVMLFPKPVRLRITGDLVYEFKAGLQNVPEQYEKHWWLKANGVTPYKAPAQVAPPAAQVGTSPQTKQ